MKLELELSDRDWPAHPLEQAEVLKGAEAVLRVGYGRGMFGGMFALALIEAIRRKAVELDAAPVAHAGSPVEVG